MSKKKTKKDHSSFWYFGAGKLLAKVMTGKHDVHIYNEAIKDIKPPFIALGNHQGFYDWAYAGKALMPHKMRIVLTRFQLFRPITGALMLKSGGIPKSQFTADPSAVLQILKTIRHGGAILMYPSGKLSLFGEDAKPFRGTYPLLKKLNVPVVMVHVDGSYRTGPRYNSDIKKIGRVDVHTSVLFTPEDLQTLSEKEGKEKLDAAFSHDDFNSPNKSSYKSKNLIKDLENILYICPKCKADFATITEGTDTIKCTQCGFTAKMDDRYMLKGENGHTSPKTISEWGRFIYAEELKRIKENPDYTLKAEMKLCEHIKRNEKLSQVGTVQAVYDREGFHIKGDRNGEPFERFYSYKDYPAIHFVDNEYLIVPDNEDVICVAPPTVSEVTKWAVVSETFSMKHEQDKQLKTS